jgi:hypothetical protein
MRRLLLILLLTGCSRPLVRGDIHQRAWLLVETEHIALRTDLDRDDAVAHALELDRDWHALAHVYDLVAPHRRPPTGRFRVVHLASCGDFERIKRNATGFVFNAPDGQDTAVTCEGRGKSTLLHELSHIFNHHHFVRAPRWVDEGLATYYETLQVRGGRAVLGNFPSGLSPYWNRPGWLPSMTAIVRMGRDEFYDPDKMGKNYFCAWKLVHVLNGTTPDRRRRFRAYLAALGLSTSDEVAWQQAFAGANLDELASDYATYQWRDRLNRLTTSYDWTRPPPPRVRALRPGEAHVLWADLLMVEHDELVTKQLDEAARVDPDTPGLQQRRISARMRDAIPQGYEALGGPPPPALAAMERDVRRLVEESSDPYALNTVAWYFAMRQQPAAGLNFAIRAVQAVPSCARCWDTLGLLYFQAGKLDRAVEAQERAVTLYADRAPPDVSSRLRRFRAALRGRPPASSGR